MTRVVLQGSAGNPDAVGARLSAELADGTRQLAEVQAGHGYLAQSAPGVFFGTGIVSLTVRWPDGTSSTEEIAAGQNTVTIKQR